MKADVTISVADSDYQALADGKLNGQKVSRFMCASQIHVRTHSHLSRSQAFMSGKLKVKGNIMLATKLDTVLKSAQSKL